jgi:hypothetical protein
MPTRKETVMCNVSQLADKELADKVMALLTAHQSYKAAVDQDQLSLAVPDAQLPDPQVFFNESTSALIIILPERHDSTEDQVQKGAAAVAKHVLEIPKVKIAVEEPIMYNDTLISNVGWGRDVTGKPQNQSLFEFEASAQGSISHQVYVKHVGDTASSASRYAAEEMARNPQRYENLEINKIMAKKLIDNTSKAGEISVFPVGPDHLLIRYDQEPLRAHLMKQGWKMLKNK